MLLLCAHLRCVSVTFSAQPSASWALHWHPDPLGPQLPLDLYFLHLPPCSLHSGLETSALGLPSSCSSAHSMASHLKGSVFSAVLQLRLLPHPLWVLFLILISAQTISLGMLLLSPLFSVPPLTLFCLKASGFFTACFPFVFFFCLEFRLLGIKDSIPEKVLSPQ